MESSNWRWLVAAFCLFAIVAIDFVSAMMSIMFDGLFAAAIAFVLYPIIFKK